jgi:serine/threonine protein kinase
MAILRLAGETVKGYAIVDMLGEGGEGVAYLAKDTRGVLVLLKENNFMFSYAPHADYRKRAERLRALIGEMNPCVARLLDRFVHDDHIFEVWEYVPGVSLRTLLERRPVLPEAEVLALAKDALRGLAWLHEELFIVHRDIKPENMMVPESRTGPAIVLIDLGIGLHLRLPRMTGRGFLGTPLYAAPESLLESEAPLDGRADLYSLGVVMYEALAGFHPYPDATRDTLPEWVLYGKRPALKGVTKATGDFVARLMSVDPGRRPNSAREALELLEPAVSESLPLSPKVPASAEAPRARVKPPTDAKPLSPEARPKEDKERSAVPRAKRPVEKVVEESPSPGGADPGESARAGSGAEAKAPLREGEPAGAKKRRAARPAAPPAERREEKSPPVRPPGFTIRIMTGPLTGKSITVPPEGIAVGRYMLNPSDWCMSRFHARLTRNGSGLTVTDVKSLNGVVHDSYRKRSLRIRPGESFSLGATTLEYEE